MRTAWWMAALLCASAARAQDGGAAPAPTERQESAKNPLSKEDAELVKDLAVLERLELLRNLELFEEPEKPKQTKEERP